MKCRCKISPLMTSLRWIRNFKRQTNRLVNSKEFRQKTDCRVSRNFRNQVEKFPPNSETKWFLGAKTSSRNSKSRRKVAQTPTNQWPNSKRLTPESRSWEINFWPKSKRSSKDSIYHLIAPIRNLSLKNLKICPSQITLSLKAVKSSYKPWLRCKDRWLKESLKCATLTEIQSLEKTCAPFSRKVDPWFQLLLTRTCMGSISDRQRWSTRRPKVHPSVLDNTIRPRLTIELWLSSMHNLRHSLVKRSRRLKGLSRRSWAAFRCRKDPISLKIKTKRLCRWWRKRLRKLWRKPDTVVLEKTKASFQKLVQIGTKRADHKTNHKVPNFSQETRGPFSESENDFTNLVNHLPYLRP